MNSNFTSKWYGFNSCMALWKQRPEDVERVYIIKENLNDVKQMLKWCAAARKPYHIVSSTEMERITDSHHHEGLCIIAKPPKMQTIEELLKNVSLAETVLYLDGVQNPHNIGSIVRVCAHFGISHILGDKSSLPNISPSMFRIAQGGMECVNIIPLKHPLEILKQLCDFGFRIVATSSHQGVNLYHYRFPRKTIILLGAEDKGVSNSFFKLSQESISIPGSDAVESLNVSVATGLVLGELWRLRNS